MSYFQIITTGTDNESVRSLLLTSERGTLLILTNLLNRLYFSVLGCVSLSSLGRFFLFIYTENILLNYLMKHTPDLLFLSHPCQSDQIKFCPFIITVSHSVSSFHIFVLLHHVSTSPFLSCVDLSRHVKSLPLHSAMHH